MDIGVRSLGHSVEIAASARKALTILANGGIDVLVTDLLMPEKDGLELIRAVRKLEIGVKIIAISGGGRIPASQ